MPQAHSQVPPRNASAFHEPFSRMQFAGYLWVWAGVALFVWGTRKTKAT
ncbi:hypothetical protein [Eikenella corrodens]|nr:hypothetical protein [Eikenella corrodens]